MKRPRPHVLEDESINALKKFLPMEWVIEEPKRDYGIDLEVKIVENGKTTNKVLWFQVKATDNIKTRQRSVNYNIDTEHLKDWEKARLPVIIFYYIKPKNTFYYIFVQKYIKERLSAEKPNWRKQKYATIKFPLTSALVNIEDIKSIADEGYFYITEQQLNEKQGLGTGAHAAHYWLDGIPKSDDRELRERTLKAILYVSNNEFTTATKEFEEILKVCTVAPTEKMSILLNLGNAYYSLSQNENALKNYKAMLELTKKVYEKEALEGKSAALGNIGLIYRAKGELDEALKYHKEALKIDKEIGYKQGEAADLGNIGLIYSAKGKLDQALKYQKEALKIDREIGYKEGEALDLGHIGLIYKSTGNIKNALKYLNGALKIYNRFKLVYGREFFQNAIDSIAKKNKK